MADGKTGQGGHGGGSTIAKFISQLDIDTIDIGILILSMHAHLTNLVVKQIFILHLRHFRSLLKNSLCLMT